MDKPVVSNELIVTNPSQRILSITVHSHAAAAWLAQTAPEFGNYFPATFETYCTLFVAEGYDVAEVMRYLASYNNEPEKAE